VFFTDILLASMLRSLSGGPISPFFFLFLFTFALLICSLRLEKLYEARNFSIYSLDEYFAYLLSPNGAY